MKIINATPKDKEELLSLYHAMIGGPCEWSENYPDENTIAFDLKNEDLFVMKNDKEEIVATISIDHDDAVEALTCGRTFKAVRQEGYAGTGNCEDYDELCL